MGNNAQFILTDEMMKKAKTYMPISEKIATAKVIAKNCVGNIKVAEQNKEGNKILSLPEIKSEDLALKTILLQNVLLGYYFDIDLDPNEDSYKQYDYYAGGHLLNQLERYKSNPELKNKAFDLLTDYKEFKKLVDTEIYNCKTNENDTLGRLTASMQLLSSPKNIKELSETLKKEMDEYSVKVQEIKAEINAKQ